MFNDLPREFQTHDIERDAYNAAFYDLGLRWFWDDETYGVLMRHATPEARIRHYLDTRHPHLLRAYDAEFLARAIEERAAEHRQCPPRPCNWAELASHPVGA